MTIHLKGYCVREYHVDPLSDFTWTSLYTHKMTCWNTGSSPVGLGKPPSYDFCLKYLSNPYTINTSITMCNSCAKGKNAKMKRI